MKKLNDVMFLFMGIAISMYGVKIILQPQYKSFRFGYVDFGEYHQLIGFLILSVGVVAVLGALWKK